MLPSQGELSTSIRKMIDSNDNAEDQDKAITEFCNELSKLLLETLQKADVVIPSGSIQTIVQTVPATGTGTGYNTVPAKGKLI